MVVMIDYVVKILLKEKKKSKRTSFTLPIAGLEPVTYALRVRYSTN